MAIAAPTAAGIVALWPGRRAADTAMEMARPWTAQNAVHRRLEISHTTRDFHMSTAAPFQEERSTTKSTKSTPYHWTTAGE
jgi:hypothetical protein